MRDAEAIVVGEIFVGAIVVRQILLELLTSLRVLDCEASHTARLWLEELNRVKIKFPCLLAVMYGRYVLKGAYLPPSCPKQEGVRTGGW